MTTEIIESKEIYRGFIALRLATLRLANGARMSREITMAKNIRYWCEAIGPRAKAEWQKSAQRRSCRLEDR